MEFDTLKRIIFADPTTRYPENFDIDGASVNDMDQVKVGKYTQWMLKNFVNPQLSDEEQEYDWRSPEYKRAIEGKRQLFLEDLYKLTEDLEKFERVKQYLPQDQRDINKFTPDSLFLTLRDFVIPKDAKERQQKKEAKKSRDGFKHAGGKIAFQGPNWTVIEIEDQSQIGKDAAIYYGGNNKETRWCTSGPGLSYFDTYIKQGPLYVILPNEDNGQVGDITGLPTERYQFHFPSNQFMDKDDRQINLVETLNGKMSELKEFFKPEFGKGFTNKGGERLEINYPDSAAGKFVALYGFNEVFDAAPKNITYMWINNTSKQDINLDVPPSITEFKDLKSLMLQNIVRSLPDNIGELKNLEFLALTDNKNLESLPESLSNCEDLVFVNLKGSNPNIELPGKLAQKLDEIGDGFYSAM